MFRTVRFFEDCFECASTMHHNGAQRMDASSRWMGSGCPSAASFSGALAKGCSQRVSRSHIAISRRSWTDCTLRSLASAQNAFQHDASGRRGGSEEEGRRDRGRFGSIGGCWNERRPRSVNVDSLSPEGKAVQHKNDQSRCS